MAEAKPKTSYTLPSNEEANSRYPVQETSLDSGYLSSGSSRSSLGSQEQNLVSSMQCVNIEDTENVYKMNHKNRGYCFVVNNTKFNKEVKMGSRPGSDVDAENIRKVFVKLGFKVTIYDNQTTAEMLKLIISVAKIDHSDCDCFAMVILSHGDEGIVYGTNGFITLDSLVAPLKGRGCKTLLGKPKLVFVQACRGTMIDDGIDVADAVPEEFEERKEVHRIPVEADFLYAFSSPAGHYSFRNKDKGSWFIQALCEIFDKHGPEMEIMRLLTLVNRRIAFGFQSRSKKAEYSGKKQVSSIVTMLTKELYFQKVCSA